MPDFFDKEFKLPEVEGRVLASWEAERTFERSVERRKGRKTFVFFEGPPTANGRPGLHHMLARAFKDVILRYKAMRGFCVPRKGGWDTHGLPVEIETEKLLGLKTKRDIERYGIAEFNAKCRESVWKYKDEWEKFTKRMGFWLDLGHPYVTYETSYMETLWWIVKRFWEKKLLYRGHKVVPWCPRCGTALSSHELAQGYKETTDNSVYVKFKLNPGQKIALRQARGRANYFTTDDRTYILSWTTTPWTLPGNVALAVGKKIEYAAVEQNGEIYILARERAGDIFKHEILNPESETNSKSQIQNPKITGANLIGLEYEPLFKIPALKNAASHRIYAADFVSTGEGTGVVHTAVMYGEDDYRLGLEAGLSQHHTVGEDGKFTKDVPELAGKFVKAKETEEAIFAHLKSRGNLLKTEPCAHEYPFCWRCGTALLYYARTSWFLAVSKLRAKLLAANEKINWVPAHLKEGRFGEWLKEAKDWNFSRERYWGTPLPVWRCEEGHIEVIGGLEELSEMQGGAKNRYWILRHGESETQIKKIIDSGQGEYRLTVMGREAVRRSAEALKKSLAKKKQKINFIISSDILRAKETADIAADVLGAKVHFDKRLREINMGDLSGQSTKAYRERFPTYPSRFEGSPAGGESLRDVRRRVAEFLRETEEKYEGKQVLVVSHEYPLWMLMQSAFGWSEARAIEEKAKRDASGMAVANDVIAPAELLPLPVLKVPRDPSGLADLHRPYIDEVSFTCAKCKKEMRRAPEVVDVWYDSGAMPFAEEHYPFERKALIDRKEFFPADYICEAVDQTRGWFYTLLAVSTLLGKGAPYKNVISLGHINDKSGQKMSKSKGNIVDPWQMMERHGADAVRWYFYSATPAGEPKNFDEEEIKKAFRRVHLLAYNSCVFWNTYKAGGSAKIPSKPNSILDRWIISRLHETIRAVSAGLDAYDVRQAALALEGFIDDLSRWHIRRSRRRFQKPSNAEDLAEASAVLGEVLAVLARMLAPFSPFFAEALYAASGGTSSVHLADWPRADEKKIGAGLSEGMALVRRYASDALAKRAELGIKVRQPLAKLEVKSEKSKAKIGDELLAILADEVNVKKIEINPKLAETIALDTAITPELRDEGLLRDLARLVQDLRQEGGFAPKDKIALYADLPAGLRRAAEARMDFLKREVGAAEVHFKKSENVRAQIETKTGEGSAWVGIDEARK